MINFIPQLAAAGVILGAIFSTPAPAQDLGGESFMAADVDGSETLTPEEFNRMIDILADRGHRSAGYVRTFGLYAIAFLRVDKDGNGIATRFEIDHTRMAFEKSNGNATADAGKKS